MHLRADTTRQLLTHMKNRGMLSDEVLKNAPSALASFTELGSMAKALGLQREEAIKALADIENMPYLDLRQVTPGVEAVKTIPEDVARKYKCLPLFLNREELTVGISDPQSLAELDNLRLVLQAYDVIFVVCDELEVQRLLNLLYTSSAESAIAAYLKTTEQKEIQLAQKLIGLGETAPIIKMVDAILERGVFQGASDVHIEPLEDVSRVRYRIDGMMHDAFTFHTSLHEAIVSRLKILCSLHITERYKPQDGRLTIELGGETVEGRLSTLRSVYGEKIVIRLLKRQAVNVQIESLGMPPDTLDRFVKLLGQPYGLILVTGPTGSGKSSTLYAALQHLNTEDANIITLEDPVEYRLAGVNQVPMNPERGVTFAAALRAVLRQDPDIVMLGEMRDPETAEIAVRVALTGHLLLSTLHTNDSVESITRLLDMGIAPTTLAPSLVGVVAQRLVRRVCKCHGYKLAPVETLRALGFGYLGTEVPIPVPRGCMECNMVGYKGRLPIFELLEMDDMLRRLILDNAHSDRIRQAVLNKGGRTLLDSGIREVLLGNTTLEEILRVVNHTG